MDPEPAVLGHGIDEVRERALAAAGEIAALRVARLRQRRARQREEARDVERVKARGIDDDAPADLGRLAVDVAPEKHELADALAGRAARAQRERAARALEVGEQREHQRVAVDDSGQRRPESRDRAHVRLEDRDLSRVEPGEVSHAVALGCVA